MVPYRMCLDEGYLIILADSRSDAVSLASEYASDYETDNDPQEEVHRIRDDETVDIPEHSMPSSVRVTVTDENLRIDYVSFGVPALQLTRLFSGGVHPVTP